MTDPRPIDPAPVPCPACHRENRPDARFCVGCGAPLERRCEACDRALPAARERLTKYSDWQAKITLIHYIQSQKDKNSVNVLSELARDETRNAAVRKAAEAAIKAIEGE